jgi:hypothetical protein
LFFFLPWGFLCATLGRFFCGFGSIGVGLGFFFCGFGSFGCVFFTAKKTPARRPRHVRTNMVRAVDCTHQRGAKYTPPGTGKCVKTTSYITHHFGTHSATDVGKCPAAGGRFFVFEHRRKD